MVEASFTTLARGLAERRSGHCPPSKSPDAAAALAIIKSEFPKVTDFEREFPSICFALATGVGKTRLMGAFISFLHLAKGINNFFVLAPNLTIYNKLIADFVFLDVIGFLADRLLGEREDMAPPERSALVVFSPWNLVSGWRW